MTQQKYVEDEFARDTAYIEDRITRDGSGQGGWPVEAGRTGRSSCGGCWGSRTRSAWA
jgi:putative glutathione S-transferase